MHSSDGCFEMHECKNRAVLHLSSAELFRLLKALRRPNVCCGRYSCCWSPLYRHSVLLPQCYERVFKSSLQCIAGSRSTSSTLCSFRGNWCVCVCVSVHSAWSFLFCFFSVLTLFYSSCDSILVMCAPLCYETDKLCFSLGILQCSWLALLLCGHVKWAHLSSSTTLCSDETLRLKLRFFSFVMLSDP